VPERATPRPAELLDAPARAMELPQSEAVALLAKVGALAEVLRVRATAPALVEHPEASGDKMLAPAEAARITGLTIAQFYRRRAFRPAIVRAGHRTLRVSEKKLRRIMAGMVSVT
jgi:hypothetical protein